MAVDPNSYTPGAPQDNPNPNLISQTRQDISAGLLEASFGILGETFAQDAGNPNLAEPYRKLGATISNALHDRWHKQEYENFQAQYVNNYQRAAGAIQNNLQTQMAALDRGELLQPDGSITKIDPKSEGFLRTKDTVIRQAVTSVHKINDQFLQDAAKYATNPYISNIAQNLMQSNAQIISEATGPTPGAETEKGYSEMATDKVQRRLMNSQAGYYDRMPSDGSGSGKEDPEEMDPMMLIRKYGIDGFARILSSTPMGRKFTDPHQTTAAGQIEKELIEKNPDLADDPEALAREMKTNEKLIQERATGLYFRTLDPAIADELSQTRGFERYFSEAEKEKVVQPIQGLLTNEETDQFTDLINSDALDEMERMVRLGQASNIDTAISKVLNKWLPQHLKTLAANNKATAEFKKTAKSRLVQFLSDPENWGEKPILRQRFGKPKRGVLDKIRDEASEAPETRTEQPERGLFRK